MDLSAKTESGRVNQDNGVKKIETGRESKRGDYNNKMPRRLLF